MKSYFNFVPLKSKIKLQVTTYLYYFKIVNIFINIDTHLLLLLLYVTDKFLVPLTIYVPTKNVLTKLFKIALYEKKLFIVYCYILILTYYYIQIIIIHYY